MTHGHQLLQDSLPMCLYVFCFKVLRKERNEHVVVFWDTHTDESGLDCWIDFGWCNISDKTTLFVDFLVKVFFFL